MLYSEKQQAVIDAALDELRLRHNLTRVCVDCLPTDDEIDRDGFEEAVGTIVFDTCFWEGRW